MTAAFAPPSAQGKPEVAPWVPPAATKADLDYAKLHTIELALLDSADPAVVSKLVETTKLAIKEDGFLFLTDYGISLQQLHRQFALAQYLHTHISKEDQERLLWRPEDGHFEGYKSRHGWRNTQSPDGIEHFNFYKAQFEDLNKVPTCIHPFMDEITAFCDYLSNSVNRRLLKLLSKVLELPDDWLWDNVESHDGCIGQGYFRHALFHPIDDDVKTKGGGLRMNGHFDYGTTTLLFSVPITCLQICGQDNVWRYVKYNPGALVVNIGQTLESLVVSGGHFKATRHRVFQPPEDQMKEQRLSLVQFNASEGTLRLQPAMESPLLQREGCIETQGIYKGFKALMDAGVPVPTQEEWRTANIAHPLNHIDQNSKMTTIKVNGIEMREREVLGVKTLIPV